MVVYHKETEAVKARRQSRRQIPGEPGFCCYYYDRQGLFHAMKGLLNSVRGHIHAYNAYYLRGAVASRERHE